jgi:glucose-6-phosphate 1-dehydrogenase
MANAISIIIFGATGDLTHRKLIPALYNQFKKGRLPEKINIIGVSRTEYSHEAFRELEEKGLREFAPDSFDDATWLQFAPNLWYISGDASKLQDMEKVRAGLAQIESEDSNRLYYLSVAPNLYEPIILNLGAAGMAEENGAWRHTIIEKPFGRDLASAQALNKTVHRVFEEHQVYRIDHYLGKETAQNVLFFRFANTIFEPVWNRNYIDNVQITVAETVDVGRRAGYYDSSGVLRDMFQNHILQLLTLVAMEPPAAFDATALRNEKVKLITSIRPVTPEDMVVGQYSDYRQAEGVTLGSTTPTYAALKLQVDNWRWRGVPFYLRCGKALGTKVTKILVEFKSPPHLMFNLHEGDKIARNILSLCIQPDEGIHLQFEAKIPGMNGFRSSEMEFHYKDSFEEKTSDAYERLIVDALRGDASLFTRNDEIEAAWRLFDPIIARTEGDHAREPETYSRGTWGPDAGDILLSKDGRQWQKSGCLHDLKPGG